MEKAVKVPPEPNDQVGIPVTSLEVPRPPEVMR